MEPQQQEKKQMNQQPWSRLLPDIIQVRVPVPFSLKWVNSYILLEQSGAFAVVDPGLRTSEAENVWEKAMVELELSWKDCSAIIVTHQHPDHYGLAGLLQQLSNAPVYMTSASKDYTERLWGSGKHQFYDDMQRLLRLHGTPELIVGGILDNLELFQTRVEPQPEVTTVVAGDYLRAGERSWQLIHTEGHAYGGIMLYDDNEKIVLCGDQVLPRITPHVGVVPGEERPVLQQFIQSLQQISSLEVNLVLPGHREAFTGYRGRIAAILAHHERRLAELTQYVGQYRGVSAFECCEWLFGKHLHDQPHNMRFAMTEVIAHLEYLVQLNRLTAVEDAARVLRYQVK